MALSSALGATDTGPAATNLVNRNMAMGRAWVKRLHLRVYITRTLGAYVAEGRDSTDVEAAGSGNLTPSLPPGAPGRAAAAPSPPAQGPVALQLHSLHRAAAAIDADGTIGCANEQDMYLFKDPIQRGKHEPQRIARSARDTAAEGMRPQLHGVLCADWKLTTNNPARLTYSRQTAQQRCETVPQQTQALMRVTLQQQWRVEGMSPLDDQSDDNTHCGEELPTGTETDVGRDQAAEVICARLANIISLHNSSAMWSHHALHRAGFLDDGEGVYSQTEPETRDHSPWKCPALQHAADAQRANPTQPGQTLPPCPAIYGIAPEPGEDYEGPYWTANQALAIPLDEEQRTFIGRRVAVASTHRHAQRRKFPLARQAIAEIRGITRMARHGDALPEIPEPRYGTSHFPMPRVHTDASIHHPKYP